MIEEAILLGGNSELRQPFSLADIAEKAGCSERTALSYTRSKETLLASAGVKVYGELSEKALEIAEQESDIHRFLNRYLDFLLANPTLVYFTLNFGHGVPHIAPLADDRLRHRVKVIADAAKILSIYGLAPSEDYLLLWSYTLRHLLYFAGYLLNDPQDDNPGSREESERIILQGLKAFWGQV